MNNIKHASEINKIAKTSFDAALNNELNNLSDLILKAAQNGCFDVYLTTSISDEATKYLEANGYTVKKYYEQFEGYSVTIYWDNL